MKARRRLARRIAAWLLMGTVWGGLALGVLLLIFAWDLPRPEAALEATRRPSVTLEAADGRLLSTSGDLYGETVRLRDLPVHLPTALLAIEDRRFRAHFGLDPVGVLRAAWVNLTTGKSGSVTLKPRPDMNANGPTTLTAIADTGSGSIMSTIFGQVTTTEKQCQFMPTIGSTVVP